VAARGTSRERSNVFCSRETGKPSRGLDQKGTFQATPSLAALSRAEPASSKATLSAFRQRLLASDFDRRLVERTLEVARAPELSAER
jgi:hypothetical protein